MEHMSLNICSICIFDIVLLIYIALRLRTKVTQATITFRTTPYSHFANLIFINLTFWVLPSFIFTKFVPEKLSFPAVSHTNEALSARHTICQACKKTLEKMPSVCRKGPTALQKRRNQRLFACRF